MSRMIHCKTCGAEIAANAKTCPACGAKNKKPIFKRWWFWVVIVLVILAALGSSGSKNNDAESSAPITETAAEEVKQSPSVFDVEIVVSGEKNNSSICFDIDTNLPDETVLMLTLSSGDYNTENHFTAHDKVTILNGTATSSGFSNKGSALSGNYDLVVSMSLPSTQSEAVRAVIGEKGEFISGNLVAPSDISESNIVRAYFTVSVDDRVIVSPAEDYQYTIFREEEDSSVVEEADLQLDPDTIISLIEMILADNFTDYSVNYEENYYTINVSSTNLASEVLSAKLAGYDESYGPWVTLKESMTTRSNSIFDFIKTCGVEDPSLLINVINDQNKDNTLLSMLNGVIIYDALAD